MLGFKLQTSDKIMELFAPPQRKLLFGIRRSALFEMIVTLAIMLAIDFVLRDQTRYWAINPHPFWFIVLFMACKYGTKEALLAMLLCSVALLLGNMPTQSINQDGYSYAFYVIKLPLLWLISAVMLGELRQMHIRERDQLEHALTESNERERRIADSYESVRQLKDKLELRIAGQLRSSISAYHAAKSMESLSPDEIWRGLEELVVAVLHPEQFSVYSLSDKGLDVTVEYGWTANETFKRHFDKENALYEAIIVKQKTLCVANAEHQRYLGGQALLAGPMVDRKSGEVVGMLKIEKMGFSDLHVSNIEAFATICEWSAMAIINARKYQASKASGMINPDHQLFTHNYFKHYIQYMGALARRVGFDVSMIHIKLNVSDEFDKAMHRNVACMLSDSVNSVLRHVDLAFEQQENNDEYSILLPATNREGAEIVLEKIQSILRKRTGDIFDKFIFTVQMIYEKPAR